MTEYTIDLDDPKVVDRIEIAIRDSFGDISKSSVRARIFGALRAAGKHPEPSPERTYLLQLQASNDALSSRLTAVTALAREWADHCELECPIRDSGQAMLNLIETGTRT